MIRVSGDVSVNSLRSSVAQETPIETFQKLRLLVEAALDKKASKIVVLDLTGRTSFCDYFIIASGNNPRHVRAVASNVIDQMKKADGKKPLGAEGLEAGRWALLDYGDVLLHVFEDRIRDYYDLEGLWLDARKVPLSELGVTQPEGPKSDGEHAAQLP